MLTSKALVSLYDQLNADQQRDFIREIYKQKTILTNEEWNMFVEPWLDELSFARLSRVETVVKILRQFWKYCEITENQRFIFHIDKDSNGEDYKLPEKFTEEQVARSVIMWGTNINDWQYIKSALETNYILNDHAKNMIRLGYVFEKNELFFMY